MTAESALNGKPTIGETLVDVLTRLLPLSLVALFLIVSVHDIAVPGLYGDEALQIAPAAVAIHHDGPSMPILGIPESRVTVGGHSIALMTMQYIGALKTFLYLPFAAVFGESIVLIRLFTLGIAALAVAATYQVTARLFGQTAAVIATLLLALDQSFILRTRVDWGPNAISIAFKMLAVVALLKWWETRRERYLVLGGLLAGLTLYNKSDFTAMLVALVVATAIVCWREIRDVTRLRTVLVAVGSFIAGASIFLWYNFRYPLRSFQDANNKQIHWWLPNVYLGAVHERWTVLQRLLDGRSMDGPIGASPWDVRLGNLSGVAATVFFCATGIALIVVIASYIGTRRIPRALMWTLLVIGFFLLFCAAIPGADSDHHVINVYPFPQILEGAVLGAGITAVLRIELSVARLVGVVAVATVGLLVVTDGVLLMNTYSALEMTGGGGHWSDAIYQLSTDLEREPGNVNIHFMDWGIMEPVVVLQNSQVAHEDEPWSGLMEPSSAGIVTARLLDDLTAVYVVSAPGNQDFPQAWRTVQAAAALHGLQAHVIKTYTQRNRVPVYQLCTFTVAGTEYTQSAEPPVPATNASGVRTLTIIPKSRSGPFQPVVVVWETGDGTNGQIYVSADGQPEKLFAQGPNGSAMASWVQPNVRHTFRLYGGADHKVLLQEQTVDLHG